MSEVNVDVSLVLLTWNSGIFLQKCLASIFRDLEGAPINYEIYIVDNGSCDGTREIINRYAGLYPQHLFPILLPQNVGTTVSRNIALRKAKGATVVILDSDVEIIAKDTFGDLIKALNESPEVGLIAPRLLYCSGKLQKSTDRFPTLFSKAKRYFFLRYMEKKESVEDAPPLKREVDYAISAFWVIKGAVLKKVGLLDENFFYAPEDVDYCLRIWQSGYSVVYYPAISCIHHAQEISRGIRLNKSIFEHVNGLIYFFKKHGYWFVPPRTSSFI